MTLIRQLWLRRSPHSVRKGAQLLTPGEFFHYVPPRARS